jgi:hypothetical protein
MGMLQEIFSIVVGILLVDIIKHYWLKFFWSAAGHD